MATQVAPLGLRLFLEGVETPVISAQTNIQPGTPASAAIQIVPADSALLLLPRTLVHLFYLDNEFVSTSSTTRTDTFGRNRDDQNRFRVADEQYKLLFAGEVIGYNYNKTPTSRSFVLNCLDLSSYWDTCYQWFADYSVGGDGFTDKHHNFVGAGQFVFDNVAAGTRWVIGNILNSKPDNPRYKELGGLMGGYIHLLEVIGGIRPPRKKDNKKPPSYKSFRGVNDFFTIAELRYSLSGMIGAVDQDVTSKKMFAHKAFRRWLQQGMSSAGSLVSFRDVLKIVGQFIFHEAYPNPAAFFVEAGTRIQDRVPELIADTAVGSTAVSGYEAAKRRLESAINVMSVDTGGVREIAATDSLDAMVKALEDLNNALGLVKEAGSSDAARVTNFTLLSTAPLSDALATTRTLFRSGDNVLFPGSIADGLVTRLQVSVRNIDRILQTSGTRKTREKDVEVTSGPHLFNQLLLPETWMLSPPRCNVLFPDQYFSFSFSRNFMREVTRLHLHGGVGIFSGRGNAKILGRHYIAPNIRDARGDVARKAIFQSSTVLMPHEVHSGIIPKFEWVTEGHRWGVKAAKSIGKSSLGKKISYFQRLANFQFFNHRWAARQLSCQSRFNPQLVIGFPGVIIDRATPSIAQIIASAEQSDVGQFMLPTAYVGKVATLQHTIHQEGGTTTVVYTHARTHRGIDDDFIGVIARENKEASDLEVNIEPAVMVDNARNGIPIDDLQQRLLELFVKGTLAEGLKLNNATVETFFPEGAIEFTADDLAQVRISFDDFLSLRARQADIRAQLDDPDNSVRLPSLLEVELKTFPLPGKYIRQDGQAAFEDLARPGWYAPDVWDNNNISEKVYLPLLGTRAITDDDQIGDPEQFSSLIKQSLDFGGLPATDVEIEADDSGNLVLKVDGRAAATLGFNLETGTTTESAIDGLTALYGLLKKRNLDVQSFIDDFTKRPIASLVEVLGDSDLRYALTNDPSGTTRGEIVPRADGTIPFEGFHSPAFGPYNVNVKHRVDTGEDSTKPEADDDALTALLGDDQLEEFLKAGTVINRGRSKKSVPIPKHLDPRGRAQARVRAYVDELKVTRGILAT